MSKKRSAAEPDSVLMVNTTTMMMKQQQQQQDKKSASFTGVFNNIRNDDGLLLLPRDIVPARFFFSAPECVE